MTWDEFLPHILPFVKGCPAEVAMDHAREAARTFCAKTLVWNIVTDPVRTRVGSYTYPLTLDDGQERVKAITGWVGTQEYAVRGVQDARGVVQRNGHGTFLWLDGSIDIGVWPRPTVGGQDIRLQLAIKPSSDADEWPDDLVEHVKDISKGAIESLALLPGYEWTNDKVAMQQGGAFTERVNSVAYNVSQGFSTYRRQGRGRFF